MVVSALLRSSIPSYRKYVEPRRLVVHHWSRSIQVCFIRSQIDGHNAVPGKASELNAMDGQKRWIYYPVAMYCDWGINSGKVDGVQEPVARTTSAAE